MAGTGKIAGILWVVGSVMLWIGCVRSPTGRRQLDLVPQAQLESLGNQAFAQIKEEETVAPDPRVNEYVQCVARSITDVVDAEHQWEVVVFDDPSPNAFALPGGHIGIYTGMLQTADSADQLAAVIAHEVAHVIADHGAERVSQALAAQGGLAILNVALSGMDSEPRQQLLTALGIGAEVGVLLPYSRTQENEADELGQLYMARAGYKPEAAIELWQHMEAQTKAGGPPEFLSTHPSHGTRMERLRGSLPQAQQVYQQSMAEGKATGSRCRQLEVAGISIRG